MVWHQKRPQVIHYLIMVWFTDAHIDGLVPDCSISIAKTLELLQSCIKPSIYASLGLNELTRLSPPYCTKRLHYTPRFNEVERGVYWYHLVRLSVCPSVDRIMSALYLQQYSSDPFHICTSYQATSESVSHVMPVLKFKNLKFWRIFIPPASRKLIGGYTGITLSVCPSVRPSICPSVDRIVSALYLQEYSSDPFHFCTSYQATSESVSRVMPISKFKNLKFWRFFLNLWLWLCLLLTWDPIWLNGMGNHEAAF